MKYSFALALIATTSAMKVNKYSHRVDEDNSQEE